MVTRIVAAGLPMMRLRCGMLTGMPEKAIQIGDLGRTPIPFSRSLQ